MRALWRGRPSSILVAVAACMVTSYSMPSQGREPLSFEERLEAQEAIERVYYAHRIWPESNPGSKPSFDAAVDRDSLEGKVRRCVLECRALDRFWNADLRPDQLQAEMDRMARQTRDPRMLRELFEALGNDPYKIAECLARPPPAPGCCRGTWPRR